MNIVGCNHQKLTLRLDYIVLPVDEIMYCHLSTGNGLLQDYICIQAGCKLYFGRKNRNEKYGWLHM